MNTFFRSLLLAAMFVLPTEAFAQSIAQVDETQVEMIAYEVVGPDSAPASVHNDPAGDHGGLRGGTLSGDMLHPAADVGLKSIYVGH